MSMPVTTMAAPMVGSIRASLPMTSYATPTTYAAPATYATPTSYAMPTTYAAPTSYATPISMPVATTAAPMVGSISAPLPVPTMSSCYGYSSPVTTMGSSYGLSSSIL